MILTSPPAAAPPVVPRLGYRPALDGIRAIAILLVMGVNEWPPVITGGYIGVDLFFVLSGFLISTLLLEEYAQQGRIRAGAFYARRALRLLPALFLLLACCTVFALRSHNPEKAHVAWTGIQCAGLYISNWAVAFGWELGPLAHTWSLAAEEQFYLVWPWVLLFLLRRGRSNAQRIRILLGGVLVVALWRAFVFETVQNALRTYAGLDTRADALLIGSALAFALRDESLRDAVLTWSRRLFLPALAIFSVVAATVTWTGPWPHLGVFTLVAFTAAVLIACALQPGTLWCRALSLRPLVWLGRISYSLYLWHFPIFRFNLGALGLSRAADLALKVALSLVFAMISYWLVETQFLRLKSRWTRVPSPAFA